MQLLSKIKIPVTGSTQLTRIKGWSLIKKEYQ